MIPGRMRQAFKAWATWGTVSATGLMACTIDVRCGWSCRGNGYALFQVHERPSAIEEPGSIGAGFVSAPLLTHDIDRIVSKIDAGLNVTFGSEVKVGA